MINYYKEYVTSDKEDLDANVVLASFDGVDYYENAEGDIRNFGPSVDSFFETFCEPITADEAKELRPNLVAAMEAKEQETKKEAENVSE